MKNAKNDLDASVIMHLRLVNIIHWYFCFPKDLFGAFRNCNHKPCCNTGNWFMDSIKFYIWENR